MREDVLTLFETMVKEQSSDLILRAGHRPVARIEGRIRSLSDDPFTEEQAHDLLNYILDPDEAALFKQSHEKDTAMVVPGVGRFRCNILSQRRRIGFVFRHVQEVVPSMEELHLPTDPIKKLANLRRGLVLVTGIAGSGKSTTLAAMIDYMNRESARHIVTVEDPIEFVFRDEKCAVTQREVGIDTSGFHRALKAAMRQTPDVILIGEMRDQETVSAALSAAETGHLVLSTLHTVNAVQTVERIISFYPPHQHQTVRLQLSLVLEGVISQRLITRSTAAGRVPAIEIMMGTPTVKEMVLEGRTRELAEAVEQGHAYYGSQSFNQSLVALVASGDIDIADALEAADSPDELQLALRGISKGASNMDVMYGNEQDPPPDAANTDNGRIKPGHSFRM